MNNRPASQLEYIDLRLNEFYVMFVTDNEDQN